MRTHNHGLFFRLGDQDYEKLNNMANVFHMPMSTVIRMMINKNVIQEYLPADYWKLFTAVDSCKNELHHKRLTNPQCNDCPECKEALKGCKEAWRAIFDSYFGDKKTK